VFASGLKCAEGDRVITTHQADNLALLQKRFGLTSHPGRHVLRHPVDLGKDTGFFALFDIVIVLNELLRAGFRGFIPRLNLR
jgi:hypothetical protein